MTQTAQQTIDAIDLQIDAGRRELYRRIRYLPQTAHEFQVAWDRNPDLWAQAEELYRQRGDAQVHRDEEANMAWKAEQRRMRRIRRAA